MPCRRRGRWLTARPTELRERFGVDVALKMEILQPSGRFKPRGITNKVLVLSDAERAAGLVTVRLTDYEQGRDLDG